MKDKFHMIILIEAEKAFDKTLHPFMILKKTSTKWELGNIPQCKKVKHDKPTSHIIFNGQKLQVFPLKSGTKQGIMLSPLSLDIVL